MQTGRVKSVSGLNLREKPNGTKKDVLPHNSEFQILDQVVHYRIKTAAGQVGYVHGDFVEKTPNRSIIPAEQQSLDNIEFKAVAYSHPSFIGEAITVDEDFTFELERVGEFAKECKLKIWVTSSLRQINQQVRGAIVTPASNSCHHVGHAIDMNLVSGDQFFNSKKLRRSNLINLPENVQTFFAKIRADEVLRWGGDFNTEDPVHIDDNLFHRKKLYFKAKLQKRVDQLNGTT